MEERWLDIPGFIGYYQASNLGRIRRLPYLNNLNRIIPMHILKPWGNGAGYLQVSLVRDGHTRVTVTVHRIVATLFCENPESKSQIDHINGVKSDNRASNLCWVTPSENMKNPKTLKKIVRAPGKGKPVNQYNLSGELIKTFPNVKTAYKETGIHYNNIYSVCNGFTPKAGGFIWRYAS